MFGIIIRPQNIPISADGKGGDLLNMGGKLVIVK